MSGRVESVSIFQTVLRGADNQTITLPNSLITASPIVNHTPGDTRRIEILVGIDYDSDIETARTAALDAIRADARVLADPAPAVMVQALGRAGVDLAIVCHVANADFLATRAALQERIKAAFDATGIGIPRAVAVEPRR
jgi:small conductance mechanosensitive channel